MSEQQKAVPDVESIMAEVRSSLKDIPEFEDAQSGLAHGVGAPDPDDLYSNLAFANRCCAGAADAPRWKRGVRKVARRMLKVLFPDVISFQEHTVRVLNKLVKVIDGRDDTLTSDILTNTKTRVDTLAHLSRRQDDLDDLRLDERLRAIEKRLGNDHT